jgi:hypothetical protein
MNPEYARVTQQVRTARRRGDPNLNALIQQRRQLPSGDTHDPNFRRLTYIRYADDFILGLIGPKSEAEAIKSTLGTFLSETLHLQMNEEKTLITHARSEQARFLGYAISVQHANDKLSPHSVMGYKKLRSVNGTIRLGLPYGLVHERAQRYQRDGKIIHEGMLMKYSDAHIIDTLQSRFRGIANYYCYAVDRNRLGYLQHVMEVSLVKTLAGKLKRSVRQIYRQYRSRMQVDDHVYRTLQVEVPTKRSTRRIYWGAISLRTVKMDWKPIPLEDQEPYPKEYARTDLITRLKANVCELCGATEQIEVHHLRKLADLKKRWSGRKEKPQWVWKMIGLNRKTLIVCRKCHNDIHAGRPTPNSRNAVRESRVQ